MVMISMVVVVDTDVLCSAVFILKVELLGKSVKPRDVCVCVGTVVWWGGL